MFRSAAASWFWNVLRRRPGSRRRRRARPRVERLEDRTVPTVLATQLLLDHFDNNDNNAFSPNWSVVQGATHDLNLRQNPPGGGGYAIRLDVGSSGGNLLTSRAFDLSPESHVTLSYFYERQGAGAATAAGDDLVVEGLSPSGTWVELGRQLGAGPDMSQFQQQQIALPSGLLYNGFQFRFRRVGSGGDWFIDDVKLAASTGYSNYWSDQSQQTGLSYPNPVTFNFPNTPAPTGGGSLTITAVGDLDGPNNYLTLSAEGQPLGNIFGNDGRYFSTVTTTVPLSQALLKTLTADGTVQVTVTPGPGVFAGSNTNEPITVRLEYATGTGNTPPAVDLNGPAVSGTGYTTVFTPGSGPVSIVDKNNLSVTDSAGAPDPAVRGLYLISSSGYFSLYRVSPSNPQSPQTIASNLLQPRDVAVDANGDLLVAEYSYPFNSTESLLRINPFSGSQEVFASGASVVFNVAANPATGEIFIDDQTQGLLRVDPLTGAETAFSPAGFVASSMSIDTNGDVLGGVSGAVERVNRVTGAEAPVSVGGYLRGNVEGTAVEPSGTIVAVSGSSGLGDVVRIDPVTGAQTLLTSGSFLNTPREVTVGDDGTIYVLDSHQAIIAVDPVTGQQTLLASNFTFEQEFGLAALLPGAGGMTSVIQSGSVTLTNPMDGAAEVLAADTAGTRITASYSAATGVLSLSGPDSPADYQRVLRTVTYRDTAASPNTTPRQIRFVLNDGTLDSPAAVSTVQIIDSAQFVKTDTATRGYWQGAYGGDGFNVVDGGAPSYPSYATVTPSGNGDYVWAASTIDPRALQKPANPVDHVVAGWYSATSFTVDVNLTDGKTHPVALYLLDWDGGNGRSERIDVLDAASGSVLDSRTASGFGSGEYLVWTIGGHVTFRFTNLSGPNAVLCGLFFGPAGTPPAGTGSAAFVKSDATTQGTWQGAYGGDGVNVVDAGAPSYPAYATVTPVGPADYVWAASTSDVRALQKPANPADRIAATWYAAGGFTVDVNLTDGKAHQVALYLLDWDGGGRSERVDVVDAVSGKVLDSRTASGFGAGDYLVWTLGGHVQLRVTGLSGPNAVLSGLFFGPGKPPAGGGSASFLKSDTATQGYWQGAYGGDGVNVIDGGAPSYPTYATVTPSGNGDYEWAASTADPRALQKPASPADRVAAMWYSGSSFTVDVNLTDGLKHQLALYLLDWDGGNGRSERIDVLDAASGAVLDSQTASNFGSGEYLVWTLGGHVELRITRLAGPNAALSGLFFGPAGTPPAGNGSAQFVKTDASTQGTWRGAYGADGNNVVDTGAPSYPAYAAVTPVGNADYVWAGSTSDVRALQKPAPATDRIAAAWYAAGTFSVDVNITDGKTHQVALYLLDWDGGNRSEQIDVLDAVTGKLLDSRTASNFGGGEYLAWQLGGNVLVRITRQSGPNAVLSGLFFDTVATT